MDNLEKLERVIQKAKEVIEANKSMEKEIIALRKKLSEKEKNEKNLLEEKEELLLKLQTVMLAKGVHLSENERKEVKKQLRIYIKEIDKCLAALNN